MPIIIRNISSPISYKNEDILNQAIKKLGIKSTEIKNIQIHKTSLDARKQNSIKFVSSVFLELQDKQKESRFCKAHDNCTYAEDKPLDFSPGNEKQDGRIVIAGFGPAGMFAALFLSENGYRPLVIERGEQIEDRIKTVEHFHNEMLLNENSNIQFGEGGAGTFSDGKLATRIHDPLCSYIMKKFVEFGAPEEILTKAKPHVGTDNLRHIVKNIRERIIELGGEIRFNTALTNIEVKNEKLLSIAMNNENIKVSALILAIGHSARDTFEMLNKNGIYEEPKPFSVGARIEHRQEEINKSLYGKYFDNPLLPIGEYQLSHQNGDRCIYTFCMCPGGMVVPSASEKNGVVTNGMSEFARDGKNANCAIVVTVKPQDFSNNILGGIEFARMIEQNAYKATENTYRAPAVTVGNFLQGKTGFEDKYLNETYACGIYPADFDKIFPEYITTNMRVGLEAFSRKISAFSNPHALLTAPETRTSSPVRIKRNDEDRQSISAKGLYPCGEGAGYAGGIISAAVDGLRTALIVAEKYQAI